MPVIPRAKESRLWVLHIIVISILTQINGFIHHNMFWYYSSKIPRCSTGWHLRYMLLMLVFLPAYPDALQLRHSIAAHRYFFPHFLHFLCLEFNCLIVCIPRHHVEANVSLVLMLRLSFRLVLCISIVLCRIN